MGILDNLSKNLGSPGTADALGLLGAYLMAAGNPTTDPNASGRLMTQGAQAFSNTRRNARLDAGNAEMQQLQQQNLEQQIEARNRAAQQQDTMRTALLGSHLSGQGPARGSFRAAQEEGLTSPGLLTDPLRRAQAQYDPNAAATGVLSERARKAATDAQLAGQKEIKQLPLTSEQMKQKKELLTTKATVKQPPSTRYQNAGPYVDSKGEFVGEGVFDRQSGTTMLRQDDGQMVPMPSGLTPRTEGGLQRNVMTGIQFHKLAGEVNAEERSMRALVRYAGRVKETGQGIDLLADQLYGQLKTVLGKDNLSRDELNTLAQTGELQRLIGGFRKEVVGGGVMTEQDALRVIYALGGNVGLLRNKEVARQLLGEMFRDKARDYNERLVPSYNEQIVSTRRGFFKPKSPISLSPDVFAPVANTSGTAPEGIEQEVWDAMPSEDRKLWRN